MSNEPPPPPAAPPRPKGGCFSFKVFLAVLLLGSICFNGLLLVGLLGKGATPLPNRAERPITFTEELLEAGESEESKVVAIPLKGLISFEIDGPSGKSMVTEFTSAIRKAAKDDKVKAILLMVNSGGGEVTASDELYAVVKDAAEKKPVLVYMLAVGASGAYYTAVGGTEIMASETCFTGSIGVILKTFNYEGLFDKVGLRAVTFKSGAFKDMLAGDRTLTPEEVEYVQAMVMQIYDKFVGIVSDERKLDLASLKDGVADGRVLSGIDALEAGLIDATGRIEDAYRRVRELAKDDKAPIVQYVPQTSFASLFKMFGASQSKSIEIKVDGLPGQQLLPGRFYLLPGGFAHHP